MGKFRLCNACLYNIRAVENGTLTFSEPYFLNFKINFAKSLTQKLPFLWEILKAFIKFHKFDKFSLNRFFLCGICIVALVSECFLCFTRKETLFADYYLCRHGSFHLSYCFRKVLFLNLLAFFISSVVGNIS